jgi:cytoskeletal protein CcmA (bactofilin family)
MWNRREAGHTTETLAPPQRPPTPDVKPTQVSTPNAGSNGSSVCIKGHLTSGEDLTVDGQVEGQIELPGHALTVGPNAKVSATIAARMMTVFGTVSGTVTVHERLDVRNGAAIDGDVTCARIAIQDGAVVTGKITMPRRSSKPASATEAPALAAAV